jgi:peptide deformylase
MMEGCLSFPKIFAPVPRWTHARLTGKTPDGPIDEIFTGLAAQAVQHEMDHLDGILFIEKMSPADRQRIAPQLRELAAATLSRRKLH